MAKAKAKVRAKHLAHQVRTNLWVTRKPKPKPFALLLSMVMGGDGWVVVGWVVGAMGTWNEIKSQRGRQRGGWWAENEDDSVRANCVRKTISPGLIRRTLDVRGGPSLIDLQPPVVTSIQWTAFDFRPRSDGLGKCVYGTSMEIERPLNSLLYAWQADFCPKVIYSPVHPRLIRMSTTTSMMTMMMMDPSSAFSQLNINHMSNFLCSFLIFHFFFFWPST